MKKILAILFFSFCISIPVILPFFHKGYFPTHDGEWAVVRLSEMFRELKDFQFPPRYSGFLNFGYGYPLFNFVYPLPYYLGVIIHFLGVGFVDTIKIIFAGSVFLSAFFMFLLSRSLWKNNLAGIISLVMYVYFPYRFIDLYVRGSIGESLSFILFPLLLYLVIKLMKKFSVITFSGIAISIAFLIMAHNIMTVLFIPVFILFVVAQTFFNKELEAKPVILSVLIGIGMAAFFWMPALVEKSNILLSRVPIADRNLYYVNPEQLLFPRWGYGAPADPNGFSYQLGIVHVAAFFLVIFYLLLMSIRKKNKLEELPVKISLLLIGTIAIYTFLLFRSSDFLWRNIPFLSEINYPWISLGILGFLISLLTGFLASQNMGRYVIIFLGLISVFVYLPYARPQYYINKGDSYYLTNNATTTSSSELMPLWVKKMPVKMAQKKVEVIRGKGDIQDLFFNSKELNFSIDVISQSVIRINTIYFPGWKIYVDNISVPISYTNERGVMDISVIPGKHIIQATFGETTLRLVSDIISLLSIITLLSLIAKRKKYEFF